MRAQSLAAIFTAVLLAGCSSTESYEWRGPAVLHGTGGAMRTEDGIEIWVEGAPDRDYQPLAIREITTTGSIGVQAYLFRQLKSQTRELAGDGFILLGRDGQAIGAVGSGTTIGTTTTTSMGVVNETTYKAMIFRYASKK